jgi:hypothetical protein
MVLDPLSAFSFAGNIVQFVDFGIRVLSDSRELFTSASGMSRENDKLNLVADQLIAMTSKLKQSAPPRSYISAEGGSRLCESLERQCNDAVAVADELNALLDRLRVRGRHEPWESFRQAVVNAWTKDEVAKMRERLFGVKEALETGVFMSLRCVVLWHQSCNLPFLTNYSYSRRDYIEIHSVQTSDRLDRLDTQNQLIIRTLLENRNEPSERLSQELQHRFLALTQMLSRMGDASLNENRRTRSMAGSRGSQRSRSRHGSVHTRRVIARTDVFRVRQEEEALLRASVATSILEILGFESMKVRYTEVTTACPRTFEWLFDDTEDEHLNWESFVDWIRNGRHVYWIQGKAGSGKSTLMRYISYHARTNQHLLAWANGDPLHIATFFFWNSGTLEQKSQTGLLRELLFDVLTLRRELIPMIFPTLWARTYSRFLKSTHELHGAEEKWTLPNLIEAFMRLVQQTYYMPLKLCFFVDGLDELDDDHAQIAGLITRITLSPNIKVCVSSRPSNVFHSIFENFPGLRLQDLTSEDIYWYARQKLYDNNEFQRLAMQEPGLASRLVSEIAEKADGVFLWVVLVVRSLLTGLRNRDRIEYLRQRLQGLPHDLEGMYKNMLRGIDDLYLDGTHKIFQIMRVAREHRTNMGPPTEAEPLTLLSLYLAVTPDLDLDVVKKYNEQRLLDISEHMQRQLTAHCGGLLEVRNSRIHKETKCIKDLGSRVQYIHRTARDFIESSDFRKHLRRPFAFTAFNSNTSMLNSCILHLAIRSQLTSGRQMLNIATSAMIYAYYSSLQTSKDNAALLDQLDRLMSSHARNWNKSNIHWSNLLLSNYSLTDIPYPSFLAFAVQYGLTPYVEKKLREHRQIYYTTSGRPLLHCAVSKTPASGKYPSSPELVRLLLKNGASPNHRHNGCSAWGAALIFVLCRWQMEDLREAERLQYLHILHLLVLYGANPKITIRWPTIREPNVAQGPRRARRRYLSATDIITQCLMLEFPIEATRLLDKLEEEKRPIHWKGVSEHGRGPTNSYDRTEIDLDPVSETFVQRIIGAVEKFLWILCRG